MSLYATLRKIASAYQQASAKYPLIAQSIQVGTLLGIGDITAQLVIQREKYDLKRTVKFSAIGLFYVGPLLYVWYYILHRYVRGKTKSIVAIKKVLLDQVVFSPLSMAAFLTVVGITENKDAAELKSRLKKEYFEIMGVNYVVWPCVQFINFYFIPPKYQIIFNQAISCIWNAYISYATH